MDFRDPVKGGPPIRRGLYLVPPQLQEGAQPLQGVRVVVGHENTPTRARIRLNIVSFVSECLAHGDFWCIACASQASSLSRASTAASCCGASSASCRE